MTALHYACLKIVRDEEQYITKSYFKSFKQNFKQGMVLGLIFLVVALIIAIDIRVMYFTEIQIPSFFKLAIFAVIIPYLCTYMYVFPLLSKFENTVKDTIKNAFLISIMNLPKTGVMILMLLFPIAVLKVSVRLFPIAALYCISAPAFVGALMYNKIFMKMEKRYMEENAPEVVDEDEHIFSDEPIEEAEESGK